MKHNVQKTKSRLIDDILLGTYDVTLCLACTENTLATWKQLLKQSIEVDLAVGELVETPFLRVGYIRKDMNRLSTNQVCSLHKITDFMVSKIRTAGHTLINPEKY